MNEVITKQNGNIAFIEEMTCLTKVSVYYFIMKETNTILQRKNILNIEA